MFSGSGAQAPGRCTVVAGGIGAVLIAIAKAWLRCRLRADASVYSCYEAGRNGFCLHRWLTQQGIIDVVVDSVSIEVNRRARRAKTDRLDSDKLLSILMRYHAGGKRVWAVARIPTPEQEDDRRLHRESRVSATGTNRLLQPDPLPASIAYPARRAHWRPTMGALWDCQADRLLCQAFTPRSNGRLSDPHSFSRRSRRSKCSRRSRFAVTCSPRSLQVPRSAMSAALAQRVYLNQIFA